MGYQIEWEPRGILLRFFDEVPSQELMRAHEALHGDGRFDTAHYLIQDFSQARRVDLDDEDMRCRAYIDRVASSYNRRLRLAHVARDERLRRGLEAYVGWARELGIPWPMSICLGAEEARRWADGPPLSPP